MTAEASAESRLAEFYRRRGDDEIEVAVKILEIPLGTALSVATARVGCPGMFPTYTRSLTPDSLARQAIHNLIEAGWTPPLPLPTAPDSI